MRADWVECTFDDVFELITNGSSIKQTDDKNGIPVSRIETIWNETIDWGRVKYAIDYDDNLHNKYLLKNGDILFSHINSDSHLGKTAIFRDVRKLIHGINLLLLRPFSILNSSYILYYLRFTKYRGGFLQIAQRSVNQSSINQRSLKQLIISIPPLPEQRAIVKKIEALFSSLDAGIADLKKAQDQLKIYRQAVLKKAFEGEFKIYSLKDLIKNTTQGWSPKCHNYSRTDLDKWAVIKTTAIQHGNFDEQENKELPLELEPRTKHEIKVGDVLITRAGPRVRVGVCCVVRKVSPKLINCDKVYRVELNLELVNPYYFEQVLNSSEYLKKIDFIKTGGNDSGVNLTQDRFSSLEIPLPSLEEQAQIVKEIEARLSVCDAVEQQIKDSLTQAEALRQSILKKAFEGRLLSEAEVTACQQEADYEPAAVLLEKIRAEKEAKKTVKKTKK